MSQMLERKKGGGGGGSWPVERKIGQPKQFLVGGGLQYVGRLDEKDAPKIVRWKWGG